MASAEADAVSSKDAPDEGTRLIYWGIGGFVATCAIMIAAGPMLAPAITPEQGFPLNEIATPSPDGTFVITVDTSSQTRWVGLSLGLGQLVPDPDHSEIAARRYMLRAPGGALDLGPVPLGDASVPEDAQWVEDNYVDGASQNKALSAWYDYSYWTHQLSSKGHTYAVRRPDAGVAYLRIESYYCEPEGTGCLTIRYRLE